MRTTSFKLNDDLYKRINLAAARAGSSTGEYTRNALLAQLDNDTEADPVLRRIFVALDTLELQDL
jgi:predicted DNA-binding protein